MSQSTQAKKDLKDYLHLYLGCEAAIGYDPTSKAGMRIDQIVDVGLHGAFTSNSDLEMFEDIKPILRPLLTATGHETENVILPLLSAIDSLDADGLNERKIEQCASLTRFLLHKRFDLFGLIDAGLAIDKTKISKG